MLKKKTNGLGCMFHVNDIQFQDFCCEFLGPSPEKMKKIEVTDLQLVLTRKKTLKHNLQ